MLAPERGRFKRGDVRGSAGELGLPPARPGAGFSDLSPQERAMAFTIFQLSSCVETD
jgi:hypothetical protein